MSGVLLGESPILQLGTSILSLAEEVPVLLFRLPGQGLHGVSRSYRLPRSPDNPRNPYDMNHCKSLGLALLGAVATLLTPAIAQGQEKTDPPKKKVIRAIRLSAAGSSRKPPTQAELKQRFTKKLEGAWIKNGAWNLDYEKALQASKASGKQVFAYFTRSYAP